MLSIRVVLRSLAPEGRTVVVASHLMSEVALTASPLVLRHRRPAVASAAVVVPRPPR